MCGANKCHPAARPPRLLLPHQASGWRNQGSFPAAQGAAEGRDELDAVVRAVDPVSSRSSTSFLEESIRASLQSHPSTARPLAASMIESPHDGAYRAR
jgi:hypothetical protein